MNNRKILKGLFEHFNIPEEKQSETIRHLDKGNYEGAPSTLIELLNLKDTPTQILKKLQSLSIKNENFQTGLNELIEVAVFLKNAAIPESHLIFNLSIARGLDYYTGTIYETFLTEHEGIGSICSGGRYENLTQKFSTSKLPGVGISIGATRLFYQLQTIGFFKDAHLKTYLLIDASANQQNALSLQSKLHKAGITAELYLEVAKFKKILKFANDKGCTHFIFFDPEENNKPYLKNLITGEQIAFNLDDFIRAQSK